MSKSENFVEASSVPEVEDQAKSSPDSAWSRIGTTSCLILIGSAAIIIAAVGFISFLWFGDINNSVLLRIILNGWVTRAITLTSIALRTAVSTQGGICLSMLAAITLEKSAVPMASAGVVSLMCAGGKTGILSMLTEFIWPMVRKGPRRGLEQFVVPTVILVLTTVTLSQFCSTALISDVSLQLVPGLDGIVNVSYDFAYLNDGTYYGYDYQQLSWQPLWATKLPPYWVTFAEYSEPPIVRDNVSDSGLSLRAFLPIQNQEQRSLIRNYTGKALVLDSRVTCQRPVMSDIITDEDTGAITGMVGPSTSTPRLDIPNVISFTCLVWYDEWSVCELIEDALLFGEPYPFSGGLVSEFREYPAQSKSGAAFLIFSPFPTSKFDPEKRTEFLYPVNVNLTTFPDDIYSEYSIAATLCYTSLDVADRWIDAYSERNRSEPAAAWEGFTTNLTAVASQLVTGYTSISPLPSAEERGIMNLQPSTNWSAPLSNESFNDGPGVVMGNYGNQDYQQLSCLTSRLHLKDPTSSNGTSTESIGNFTAVLSLSTSGSINPVLGLVTDFWLADLFDSFMTNYSTSVALQAVITTLAGIEYYDRLQQYNKWGNVSQSFFVSAQTGKGPFGQKRDTPPWGFIAVMIVLIFHTILVIFVTTRFLTQSGISRIGDSWQSIAQVALSREGVIERGLRNAIKSGAARNIVEKNVKEDELENNSIHHVHLVDNSGLRIRQQSNRNDMASSE